MRSIEEQIRSGKEWDERHPSIRMRICERVRVNGTEKVEKEMWRCRGGERESPRGLVLERLVEPVPEASSRVPRQDKSWSSKGPVKENGHAKLSVVCNIYTKKWHNFQGDVWLPQLIVLDGNNQIK